MYEAYDRIAWSYLKSPQQYEGCTTHKMKKLEEVVITQVQFNTDSIYTNSIITISFLKMTICPLCQRCNTNLFRFEN